MQLTRTLFRSDILMAVTQIVDRLDTGFDHRLRDHQTRVVHIRLGLVGEANAHERLAIALNTLQDDIAVWQLKNFV